MALNHHAQNGSEEISDSSKLITEYIIDIPNPETTSEDCDTLQESIDKFMF